MGATQTTSYGQKPEKLCKTCKHWGDEVPGENRRQCTTIDVLQKTSAVLSTVATAHMVFAPDFGCKFYIQAA